MENYSTDIGSQPVVHFDNDDVFGMGPSIVWDLNNTLICEYI